MKGINPIEEIVHAIRTDATADIIPVVLGLDNLEQTDRDGRTLLINAAFYNRLDIIEWLIQYGANINASDHVGNTALHAAVQEDNLSIVRFLLINGANVNQPNKFGNTPIWIVKPTQSKEIIDILLLFGADPTIKNNFGISALERMAAYPNIIEIYQKNI